MCMNSKAALLVMNLGVQREENEQCVSTARASSERREHPAGIWRPLRADMYRTDRRQCGVELQGRGIVQKE